MQAFRHNLNFVYLQKTKILILHLAAIKPFLPSNQILKYHELLRKEFYRKITLIEENFITMNNSGKVQFLFRLSETEKETICQFSKFVCQSFKVKESHM